MPYNDYLTGLHDSMNQGAQIMASLMKSAQEGERQDAELQEQRRQFDLKQAFENSKQTDEQGGRDFANKMALLTAGQPVDADNQRQGATEPAQVGGAPFGPGTTIPPQPIGIPTDPGRVLSYKGTKAYIPTSEENDKADLRKKVLEAHALADENSWGLPDAMAKHLGLPGGLKIPHEAVSEAFRADAKAQEPPQAEKAPRIPTHFATNDRGDMTAFSEDPQTGKITQGQTFKGVGTTKVRGGETAGQSGVQDRFDQKELDRGQNTSDKLDDVIDNETKLRSAYQNALDSSEKGNPNYVGEDIIDPKTGKEVTMSPARRSAYKTQMDASDKKIAELKDRQKQIRQRYGLGEFAQAPAPAQKGGTATRAPGAAAPPPKAKTASMEDVRGYGKANKLTEAQALLAFQTAGYKISGAAKAPPRKLIPPPAGQ